MSRALTGRRVLTQQFENADMVYTQDGVNFQWENHPTAESEWQSVFGKAMTYNEQYLDLTGYELDDLTLGTVTCRLQDPGVYMYSGDADVFGVYDIVSQERLTEEDMRSIKANFTATTQSAPGMSAGPLDRAQIVSGTFRLFTKNSNIVGLPTLMLNARTVRFGSGSPTAVQKLWCYRIVVFITGPLLGDTLTIPASTLILIGDVYKEDELPYMMRLKRSYELSTD